MLLTRNKIDRLTALWNAEAIDLKTALEENNIITNKMIKANILG